ncbi:hypothetical protein UFOVP48_35 [uncultured Caudovirales phage]|uniref:Uncharacterized protein n=1 Tax=uncultured Caudovirales phage TaxID=2100421 RepID=A0A6J5KRC4_9CAUD|nr:hypothetical protein UFOVP48_35 [uncultured Caudovirales phage]
MKLHAGNPNLMAKATRVNKTATLQNLPTTLGDKNPAKYVRGGAVLMERTPDMATPPSINIWKQPVYKPEPMSPARPGADNHLRYKSKGYQT